MKRLTKDVSKIALCGGEHCKYGTATHCEDCGQFFTMILRLAEYERTGLMPEQVEKLKQEHLDICDRISMGDCTVGLANCPFLNDADVD